MTSSVWVHNAKNVCFYLFKKIIVNTSLIPYVYCVHTTSILGKYTFHIPRAFRLLTDLGIFGNMQTKYDGEYRLPTCSGVGRVGAARAELGTTPATRAA